MSLRLALTSVAALVLVTTFFPISLNAQVPALEFGSAGAARAIAEHNRRMEEQAYAWKTSTKLTVLEKVPEQPRDQSGCLDPQQLRDKSIGYLEYWQFEVVQVIGENDLLLAMKNPDVPPIWFAGYSTKGLAVGDKVRLVGLVEVNGTKSYNAVSGAMKTVRIVRLVSREKLAKIEEDAKEQAELNTKAGEELLFRTWTSASGKLSVEAKFVKFEKGRVHLEKRDGALLDINPADLSATDRDHYRALMKKNSSKAR